MLISGIIFAILSIVLGAFGAHSLKQIISTQALATFEVGVRYQMYHALALIIVGMSSLLTKGQQKIVFLFFTLGILLFSGSIYLLSLNEVLPFKTNGIGLLTPLGGGCFIIGWCYFLLKILKLKSV